MQTEISIDLEDEKSKYIAEIIGNKSCKKILKKITEKEMTETDLSKELNIPLNTVDYNIKKLLKAGLIESNSHFWSVKGKRIPSYKIANKKIIISPGSFSSKILLIPSLAIGGALALIVKKITEYSYQSSEIVSKYSDSVASLSSAAPVTNQNFFQILPSWQWFLIGIWSGIIIFFILNYVIERRKK